MRDALEAFYHSSHHLLATRSEITSTDLKGFVFSWGVGNYLNAEYGWQVIKNRCEEAGFTPITKSVPFSTLEDAYSIDLQDSVCVVGASTEVGEIFKERGCVEISIKGQFGCRIAVFKKGDKIVEKIVDRFSATFDEAVFSAS